MIASVPEFPMRASREQAPIWTGGHPFAFAPASLGLRFLAYLVDVVIVGCLAATIALALVVLGFVSLGASWLLIAPALAALPFLYSGVTLSSPSQATLGMRLFGLHLRSVEGHPIGFVIGLGHTVLFYVFMSTMTPLILLVGVLRHDRALLQDLVLRLRLVTTPRH